MAGGNPILRDHAYSKSMQYLSDMQRMRCARRGGACLAQCGAAQQHARQAHAPAQRCLHVTRACHVDHLRSPPASSTALPSL